MTRSAVTTGEPDASASSTARPKVSLGHTDRDAGGQVFQLGAVRSVAIQVEPDGNAAAVRLDGGGHREVRSLLAAQPTKSAST